MGNLLLVNGYLLPVKATLACMSPVVGSLTWSLTRSLSLAEPEAEVAVDTDQAVRLGIQVYY